jgi:hypothetical protein
MILLNSLTPITFVALYQLLFGNLLLGLLESYLVKKFFTKKVNYLIIIIANYVSAIIGFIISNRIFDPTDLNMIRNYNNGTFPNAMFAYTGIALIVTLIVELPFFFWGIRNLDNSKLQFPKLLQIIITIHIFSYLVTILTWLAFV